MKTSRKASVSLFISIILLFSFSPNVAKADGVVDALSSAVSALVSVANLVINAPLSIAEMTIGIIPGLDFLAADGNCRWSNLSNSSLTTYAGECDSGTKAILIAPTSTNTCNFQIPLTFYIPLFNTSYELGNNCAEVYDYDSEDYVTKCNVVQTSMNETNRNIAVYRLAIPVSGGQAKLNDLLFYGSLYNDVGSGWMSLDASNFGWVNGLEAIYNSGSPEITPATVFPYSDGCVGNVCKYVDGAVPDNSYVVYYAKILGSYTGLGPVFRGREWCRLDPNCTDYTSADLLTLSNKFLNTTNGNDARLPAFAFRNDGSIAVDVGSASAGPFQTGVATGCTCTSAPNACGQTGSGTITSGVCNATVPPNPAGYGLACASVANACGQTSSGTIGCDGSCSALAPSDASCPRYLLSVALSGNGTGTVTSNPSGINCGSDCSESYISTTPVTLSATAAADSVFSGWFGDADCSDGNVTMTANRSCTAAFDKSNASKPDLIVQSLSVSGTLTAGNSLSFSGTVKNQGARVADVNKGTNFAEDASAGSVESLIGMLATAFSGLKNAYAAVLSAI